MVTTLHTQNHNGIAFIFLSVSAVLGGVLCCGCTLSHLYINSLF